MLLAGNIISFVGCVLMISIGLIKNKKHMILAQTAQFSIMAVGHLLLSAYSAVISCVVSTLRIFVFTRFKKVPLWLKLAFLAAQTVLTCMLGARTFFDWVPLLSMVLYTLYFDNEDPVVFKLVNMAGLIMWVFHDFHYRNYASGTFDILTIISTTLGIVMIARDRRKRCSKERG